MRLLVEICIMSMNIDVLTEESAFCSIKKKLVWRLELLTIP